MVAIQVALGAACLAPAQAQPARPAGVSLSALFGEVIRNSRWKNPAVPVCWEDPKPEDAAARSLVRRAVGETWEDVSAVRFVGWGACAKGSVGVRIEVADEGPHTRAIGRYLNAMPSGMVLNFSFQDWGPKCQANRDFCIYAIAVHEFGHALGFTHEQNRDDAPKQCRKERTQGSVGDYRVTKYDPDSIMNYCNPHWNGDGKLSTLDVQAVQTFYGK